MSLWYQRQVNHYARNVTATAVSTYIRGGQLDHIDYGTRQDNGVDSDYPAGVASARVLLATQGSTCVQSNPSNWPDVPWDQQCDSASNCTGIYTPTFFTQKMLATVTTQVWTGTGTSYRDVEQWTLNHVFKDPGDGHAKTLWLNSISHAGLNGTRTTTPDVTFNAVQLNNRVDTAPSKDPIIRYRISSLVNESGGVVSVTYSAPECVLGSNMPSAPDSNTKRCYPVWWTPYGQSTATFDWFHKYVVTGVTVTDPVGGAPAQVFTYTYQDSPAWHYDDAELVPTNHKSWGQWRGYAKVRVTQGAAGSAQQQTDTVYFRGMHGDKTSGGTRSVQLAADPDFPNSAINDEDWRHGQLREKITYNGVGNTAPVVSKTLTEPWESGPTASRTRNGVTTKAYLTNARSLTALTALDAGRGWLTTKTTNTFDVDAGTPDPIGRIVKVDEANDVSTAADDRCTTTTYATDPTGRIQGAVAEVVKVGVSCASTPNLATDVISDTRTWYDNATSFDQTVSKGEVTRTEQIADVVNGAPVYLTRNRATYDSYGRVLTSTDALGQLTGTAYTPASGALVTSVTTTNPMNWTSTDTLDPAYGLPTAKVDPNGSRTDLAYDGLGRLTSVWLPGWSQSAHPQNPSKRYTYVLGGSSGATSVATAVLTKDGTGYLTSYMVYDGLLRQRQTQAPAAGGGAVITDTLYDSRGLSVQSNQGYFTAGVSWGTVFVPTGAVPGRTLTDYDNAGRARAVIFQVNGVEKWRTTTTFSGDHTDTTVPAGGTAKSTYMNALGQTTKLRQYHGNTPTGSLDDTVYGYDKRGNTATITDPAGSV
jgi:YD repeat-containing protein